MNASRGRTVEPFHPEPVGGLGAASALRAFKKLPCGGADAGLLGDGESCGFEKTFFVGKGKVGCREFDEPGRHIFLRDKRSPREIITEPKMRLRTRPSGAPAGDEFGKEFCLFRFEKVLGGGAERREGNAIFCRRRRSCGLVGQSARCAVSDEGETIERRDGFSRDAGLLESLIHEPETVAVGKAFREKSRK